MLLDADPSMRGNLAETFGTTLNAAEKLPLMSYWLIQNVTTDNVLEMKPESLLTTMAEDRLSEALKWLDKYSLGLLTANGIDDDCSHVSNLE